MDIGADKNRRAFQDFEKDWKQLVECGLVEAAIAERFYVITKLDGKIQLEPGVYDQVLVTLSRMIDRNPYLGIRPQASQQENRFDPP